MLERFRYQLPRRIRVLQPGPEKRSARLPQPKVRPWFWLALGAAVFVASILAVLL